MTQELPDDPDKLKEYIEYLLDQNQWLHEEVNELEKEKLSLYTEKSSLKLEKPDIRSEEDFEEAKKVVGETVESLGDGEHSDWEFLIKSGVVLMNVREIKQYLKEHKPGAWEHYKPKYDPLMDKIEKSIKMKALELTN